jgi:nitrate reductase NapD
MNVSGIVVKTKPEHLKVVLDSLNSTDLCEVHFHDEAGKIVVTIEGENVNEEMIKMKKIQSISNVISAELVYSYSEDELAQAEELFKKRGDAAPDVLNSDDNERLLMGYFSKIKRNV